jgi:hypothetical protein
LVVGTHLILRHVSKHSREFLEIYSVGGKYLASYSDGLPTEPLWKLLEYPELVNAVIESVELENDMEVATVTVQGV